MLAQKERHLANVWHLLLGRKSCSGGSRRFRRITPTGGACDRQPESQRWPNMSRPAPRAVGWRPPAVGGRPDWVRGQGAAAGQSPGALKARAAHATDRPTVDAGTVCSPNGFPPCEFRSHLPPFWRRARNAIGRQLVRFQLFPAAI
jgi:hypothetical protein